MHLWRGAGVAFLAVSLAALAAGAFPELIVPAHVADRMASPPALRAVLAAGAGFVILFCPLVLARRGEVRPTLRCFLAATGEYLLVVIAAIPLYVVAAWLADAVVLDVVRGVLYLTGVAVGAWGLALWASAGRGWLLTAAALLAAIVAIAMPVTYYLVAELTAAGYRLDWLWQAAPVTCAFSVAASRSGTWHPAPLWAWALWPAVGAALTFARLLLPVAGRRVKV